MPESKVYTANRNYPFVRKALNPQEQWDWFTEQLAFGNAIDVDVQAVDEKAIAAGDAADTALEEADQAQTDASNALLVANGVASTVAIHTTEIEALESGITKYQLVTTATADIAVTTSIVGVDCDTIGAECTLTILTAGIVAGRHISIIAMGDASTNPVTIAGQGSELIDGYPSITINRANGTSELTCASATLIKSAYRYADTDFMPNLVSPPYGFEIPATMYIPRVINDNGTFRTVGPGADYERPTGKTYYLGVSGSDSNDGLTALTAFGSVAKCQSQIDARVIIVEGGLYVRNRVMDAASTRDLSYICPTGDAVFASWESRSWTQTGGYTNVYQTSRSSTYDVRDRTVLDSDGLYTGLTLVASIADVDATENTWYTDGATVYAHRAGGGSISDNALVCLLTVGTGVMGDANMYIEGITFEGGDRTVQFNGADRLKRYRLGMKDCHAYYCSGDGFQIIENVDCIFESCSAIKNQLDGFNYHGDSDVSPTIVEINCTGSNNGNGLVNTNNGTSIHEDTVGIRFGGSYEGNHGPNVADINTSKSWNVGCTALNSIATANNADWQIENEMYVDTCTGDDFDDYTGAGIFYTHKTDTGSTPSTPYNRTPGQSFGQVHPNIDPGVPLDDFEWRFDTAVTLAAGGGTGTVTVLSDDVIPDGEMLALDSKISITRQGYADSTDQHLRWDNVGYEGAANSLQDKKIDNIASDADIGVVNTFINTDWDWNGGSPTGGGKIEFKLEFSAELTAPEITLDIVVTMRGQRHYNIGSLC